MNNLLRLMALASALLFGFLATQSRVAVAEDTSTIKARLAHSVKYLASDELEGRGIGTEGINKAADYVAAEFSKIGLKTRVFG
ncbi:MAG: aminopeptidase, partial [Planctomycetes bacterium]|nr:aminopeptidase [Planctomycetota bacterium]